MGGGNKGDLKDPLIWLAFAQAIETPNFFRHDHHICFTPQLVADNLTFGSLLTYFNLITDKDADKTQTIALWGVNQPHTNPAKALVVQRARKAGAKIIVIDPRSIPETKTAHLWLRVREIGLP